MAGLMMECSPRYLLGFLYLAVALATYAQAGTIIPLLYPSVDQSRLFVEDLASGQLLPSHGAIPWFLCSTIDPPLKMKAIKKTIPLCRQLAIYSNSNELNLTLSIISLDGQQEIFTEAPRFKVGRHGNEESSQNRDIKLSKLYQHEFTEELLASPTIEFKINTVLLKPNVGFYIQAAIGSQVRWVNLVFDPSPPKAAITTLTPSIDESASQPQGKFVIQFSERIVPIGSESESHFCDSGMLTLSRDVQLFDLIETSRKCSSIGGKWDGAVVISGATNGRAVYDKDLAQMTIYTSVEPGVPANIQVALLKGAVMDYAGNLNEETVQAIAYYRPTPRMTPSMRRSRLLSQQITLPAAAKAPLIDTTTAAALGSAASAATAAAAALSAASSASGSGGGGGNPIDLINMAQKMYLTGLMAIQNFPENYGAFVGELNWAVFNVDTPWEKAKKLDEELRSENATITATGIEEEEDESEEEEGVTDKIESISNLIEAKEDESPYDHLRRVFFWVPLAYLLILILHSCCLCCCICKRKPIPDILQFPRIELMFAFWGIPAIAGASAGLYQGKRIDALFATWLLIVFPASFMAWNVFMLYYHFYSRHPADRKANMVLASEEPPKYVTREYLAHIKQKLKSKKSKPKTGVESVVRRNIWDGPGTNSPVAFVNPAFLESQSSMDSETQLPWTKGHENGSSKLLTEPNQSKNVKDDWREVMNKTLESMVTNERVNNALVIPRLAKEEDHFSADFDDLTAVIADGSVSRSSPLARSFRAQSFRSPRLNREISGSLTSGVRDSAYDFHAENAMNGGEMWMSVVTPDAPLSALELRIVEATQEEVPIRCNGWKDIGKAPIEEEKPMKWNTKRFLLEQIDFWIVSLFVGRTQQDGEWITTSKTDSKFIARYGPLFEDHRGHPVVRREGTLDVNRLTGKVDRGALDPVKRRYLFKIPALRVPCTNCIVLPSKKIYRFQLQILTRLLDFTKIILLACLVSGLGNSEDNMGQILALFVGSTLNLVVIRIARPFPTRLDMTVTMLAEGADVATFFLGIILLAGPSDDKEFRLKVGRGMLYAEGAAFLSLVLERMLMGVLGLGIACSIFRKEKVPKMAEVVLKAIGRYERFLERKYCDRWMVKVLKRGLHNRPVRREELPVWYYIRVTMLDPFLSFSWLRNGARSFVEHLGTWMASGQSCVRLKNRQQANVLYVDQEGS